MKYNRAACDTALGRPTDQAALGCLEAHVQLMEICLDRDDRELSNLCTFEQRNGIKEHDAVNRPIAAARRPLSDAIDCSIYVFHSWQHFVQETA